MEARDERRGIGTLLSDLGNQVGTLVRKEIELARLEITAGVGKATRGAALAGVGGALVYAGSLVLMAALVLGLIAMGMEPWLSALLVGGLAVAVGAVIASTGVRQIHASDLAPKQTAETIRENVDFVKEHIT
jgi:predicted phage tail protein